MPTVRLPCCGSLPNVLRVITKLIGKSVSPDEIWGKSGNSPIWRVTRTFSTGNPANTTPVQLRKEAKRCGSDEFVIA